MRPYKYIPFPELRRQHKRRLKLRRMLADSLIAVVWAACGVMAGLMAAGMWIEF